MAHAATESHGAPKLPPSAFLPGLMIGFAALIVLSILISFAGRWFGHSISMAGHTESTRTYEVVIGNNVIVAPGNMIRFDNARRDGVAQRLDLYLRWPTLQGYSDAYRDDFNNVEKSNLVFASLEPRLMSRDMSGRFEPIYRGLIDAKSARSAGGLTAYDFSAKSGYANEQLFVGNRQGQMPFVARCLVGPAADQSLAACQRDVDIGDDLSLSYRFPAAILADWTSLDAQLLEKARSMVRTSRR